MKGTVAVCLRSDEWHKGDQRREAGDNRGESRHYDSVVVKKVGDRRSFLLRKESEGGASV